MSACNLPEAVKSLCLRGILGNGRKMTRHDFFLAVLLSVSALAISYPAIAQQRDAATPAVTTSPPAPTTAAPEPIEVAPPEPVSCDLIEDAIIPLRPPTFNGMIEWRKVIGLEGVDRLAEMLPLADGGVIALGESRVYTRASGLRATQLYVIRLDVSGKPLFDKRIDIKGLVSVAGGIIFKDKIIVLSQVEDDKKKQSTRIDFLDGAASIKATYTIDNPAADVLAGDVVMNADATSMTIAAMMGDPKLKDTTYTVLYRMGLDGKILDKREYLPGVSTRIERLQRLSNGFLIAAGRMRVDAQREAGWLLLISKQGDLVIQRPYPRGGQAQLKKIVDDRAGGYYALGEAIPADGGYRAAWIMHLNGSGNVIWQRFLSGKYRYSAADLTLQKDGRLMILMAGRPGAEGGREHARIITMSSIGTILFDEAYIEGSNALPVRLIEHTITKQRLLAGYAQTGFDDYGVPGDQKLITYDVWLSGLTKLPPYIDPCKPTLQESLDDNQ